MIAAKPPAKPAPAGAPSGAEALGAAAHEIKNALGPLAVTLERAERKAAAGEAVAREELAFARAQVRRVARLVGDLLDVTEADLGDLPVRARSGDAAAAAREAAEVFCRGSARDVTLEVPDAPVPAWFDPDRLSQVLLNLLDNAAKYAPAPAAITVAVCARAADAGGAPCARIEVRDQGPGLPPGAERAVFDRFVRARAEGDGTRGLGLGLYLCRRIVERHGGRIGVDSVPGRGATFWIELPPA